jgi:orotidine-5'-phosphate decarboxylase
MNQLLVALDVDTAHLARALADQLRGVVGGFKIGSRLFTSHGPSIVEELAARGDRVFLDLKFHDIPNTVARAVAAAARSGAALVNVHAAGGRAMLVAAREAAASIEPRPRIIAVTLLTSIDARALADLPMAGHPEGIARRLAGLAKECGLDGVVCSPEDLAGIRQACGTDFLTVVPGIRPPGSAAADQKRTASPGDAIRRGADILVVGRPVTAAPDPDEALGAILLEIESALPQ